MRRRRTSETSRYSEKEKENLLQLLIANNCLVSLYRSTIDLTYRHIQ